MKKRTRVEKTRKGPRSTVHRIRIIKRETEGERDTKSFYLDIFFINAAMNSIFYDCVATN